MKKYLTFIAATLFAFGLIGCSKQAHVKSAAVAPAKVYYDLGLVEISDGIKTRHVLKDGRVCVIRPALQADGTMMLNLTIEDSSGRILEKFEPRVSKGRFKFDGTTTFTTRVGDFEISMKPNVKQWHTNGT